MPTQFAVLVQSQDEVRAAIAAGARMLDLGSVTTDRAFSLMSMAGGAPVLARARDRAQAEALAALGARRVFLDFQRLDEGRAPAALVASMTREIAAGPAAWERLRRLGLRAAAPEHGGMALTRQWSPAELASFADRCRAEGMAFGFSGSLEAPDAPRLLALRPAWIVFDDMVRDEMGALSPERTGEAIALFRTVDPARGGRVTQPEVQNTAQPDRVFLRDFRIDYFVGVHSREYGAKQPLRFTVEIDVLSPQRFPPHFSDVLSYDIVIDRIRALSENGHFDLLETIAEEVARAALDHPLALRARVVVEKLAVLNGSVGVEIVREKNNA